MKKVLTVLSGYGYWGEELVGPMEVLEKAGYSLVIATPKGTRPQALPPSMDSTYIDPPLGKTVVSKEMELKVRELDSSSKLDNPINLASWLPERPYISSGSYLRDLEAYYEKLDKVLKDLEEYDALLLIGGSGPIVDMVNNQRVHDLVLGFYQSDKPIAAECYGVACLAFARDYVHRKSIIWGKHVTGHPIEYDYKDGTGFVGVDFNMGPPPYPLEYILRDAVGPFGQYHGNVGKKTSVIVDYPFITSRSTASSYLCGEKLLECLEEGLMQYGF
ncbi:MAG: type 1 glutamine amidotransferase domain-containing protein [Clostridiaceae bacterium]|nr:type 1 glutamine amidotransferase domain-containing protein [Clostridiaceae bacterium]